MSTRRGAPSWKKQVAATRAEEAREAKRRKKIVAQVDGDEQDCHMTEAKTLLNLSENRASGSSIGNPSNSRNVVAGEKESFDNLVHALRQSEEARTRIELKEAQTNDWCATLVNNIELLKKECARLGEDLELQRTASQKIATEAANLRADRNKLRNEVATLYRLNNMSSESNNKAIGLIKELLVEKKNLEMKNEDLIREKIKAIDERHEQLKYAIATQEAKLTAQGELKKLKDENARSSIVIENLKKEVEHLRAEGNA